ncbi:amino acid ABC transporter substrate-binding protein [Shimia sp. Alg240-R146]|uniref:amino acid ABC transporter substrate-binding protein n=1 Tax=Shimia sp. Alg240-R146 TaxID=2993449 RepID=UPI0022E7796F|nr:amino acid ABC transporter substrate-binding protein [Shimia sp. Alg240-R146]
MRLFIAALFATLSTGALHAQTIDRILERNEIRLGFRSDAPPMSFQIEDGSPTGYTPALCVHVAQGLVNALQADNLEVQFVEVDANDRFDRVASGEIDLLCGVATITLERRALVDFSIPVYVDGTSVLLPATTDEDLRTLNGKSIGVRRDTTTDRTLSQILELAEIDVKTTRFVDHESAIIALEKREIDAYFADQSILAGLWMSSPQRNELKLARETFTLEKQGLAMARGDTDFRLLVDGILSGLYANGTVRETMEKAIPGLVPGPGLTALFMLAPEVD